MHGTEFQPHFTISQPCIEANFKSPWLHATGEMHNIGQKIPNTVNSQVDHVALVNYRHTAQSIDHELHLIYITAFTGRNFADHTCTPSK